MSARRTTERDRRRRQLGQNFLVDRRLIAEYVGSLGLGAGDLVVEFGAGGGAMTLALVETGADVWAVECDPLWAQRLRTRLPKHPRGQVRVLEADLRRLRLPRPPFRVVANPPFGLTTELLSLLLDRPERGPERADLILQREVAVKHSHLPPRTLRTAAWTPWWEFRLGQTIERNAFRPRPSVEAAGLTIVKRDPPIMPARLAPAMRELLRPAWTDRVDTRRRKRSPGT